MLTLPIKKKWFDMILSGKKKEEYREIKQYYTSRFDGWFDLFDTVPLHTNSAQIRFTNGYGNNVPSFIADCHIEKHTGKPEWGAIPNQKYYVIHIEGIKWKSYDNSSGYLIKNKGE